ncbi:MAG: hypothetical protein LBU32_10985 [Clostridiales bacterium]|nr:hypothetical protein [Clostridiales bacterium]
MEALFAAQACAAAVVHADGLPAPRAVGVPQFVQDQEAAQADGSDELGDAAVPPIMDI